MIGLTERRSENARNLLDRGLWPERAAHPTCVYHSQNGMSTEFSINRARFGVPLVVVNRTGTSASVASGSVIVTVNNAAARNAVRPRP